MCTPALWPPRAPALLRSCALALLLPSLAHAQTQATPTPIPAGIVTGGSLSFDARATMGDFTGVTDSLRGRMTGGPVLDSVRGWVEAPVRTLVTGNGRRDGDLRKSMEADRFPLIRFDLDSVNTLVGTADSVPVLLHGTFTIHGVRRPATFHARVHFEANGIRLRADLPMDVRDYEVGGLSKFLGILKMEPNIVVHVDVLFAPGADDAQSGDAPAGTPPARE